MVIVASIYLRFYIEVGVGVGTFLPTPTPAKIPIDSTTPTPTPTRTPQPWIAKNSTADHKHLVAARGFFGTHSFIAGKLAVPFEIG
jgi:hypothetical protein